MVLVNCEMHGELVELDEWQEGHVFICASCALIMEKIAITEKQKGVKLTDGQRLRLFDKMRKIYLKTGVIS